MKDFGGVLQPGRDADSFVIELLFPSGELGRHQHYARGSRWRGGQYPCLLGGGGTLRRGRWCQGRLHFCFFLFLSLSNCFVSFLELELEVIDYREGVDEVVAFVHA